MLNLALQPSVSVLAVNPAQRAKVHLQPKILQTDSGRLGSQHDGTFKRAFYAVILIAGQ